MAKMVVEVITSERRRRHWARADKDRVVAAALQPGATTLGARRTFGGAFQPGVALEPTAVWEGDAVARLCRRVIACDRVVRR